MTWSELLELGRLAFGGQTPGRNLEAELVEAFEHHPAEMHAAIVRELQAAGYESVTIDPKGYRTGSLNEGLILRQV